jgi:hypothetical protein
MKFQLSSFGIDGLGYPLGSFLGIRHQILNIKSDVSRMLNIYPLGTVE